MQLPLIKALDACRARQQLHPIALLLEPTEELVFPVRNDETNGYSALGGVHEERWWVVVEAHLSFGRDLHLVMQLKVLEVFVYLAEFVPNCIHATLPVVEHVVTPWKGAHLYFHRFEHTEPCGESKRGNNDNCKGVAPKVGGGQFWLSEFVRN